jgi:hypothetical protein
MPVPSRSLGFIALQTDSVILKKYFSKQIDLGIGYSDPNT